MSNDILYDYVLPPASHWSLRVRRGISIRFTDVEGGANLGILFFNPENLLERYNAPDTLKCQHTFKLSRGHCLYSDMGRIFCSITEDDLGWHDTVCGNSNASQIDSKWGEQRYQQSHNDWTQNGHDSFLVEMAKYGLGSRDMPANLNLFSRVATDEQGNLMLDGNHSPAGASVTLRFEMDTLVMLHSCPHPLSQADEYPRKPVLCEFFMSDPISKDDYCVNFRPENQRGFDNNRLYYLGADAPRWGMQT